MNGLILGLYGVFILIIGMRGRTDELMDAANVDAPKFIPWALAIVALIIMAQNEYTEKVVKPFAALLVLNFVLVNFGNIKSEVGKIIDLSKG